MIAAYSGDYAMQMIPMGKPISISRLSVYASMYQTKALWITTAIGQAGTCQRL